MLRRHYLTVVFGLADFFLLIGFSLYYVKLAGVTHLLIIHFIARRGADVLGDKYDVLGILTAGSIITILNIALATVFYARNRSIAYLLGIITALIALLILLAVIGIISVN
jgi:hypothetical protein